MSRRIITVSPEWKDRRNHRAYQVVERPKLKASIGESAIAKQLRRLENRRADARDEC